ncbi:MAG: DUF1566 domain-containing protein, partial [Deltaproteobacteria bacterium]|nr:DUF1566 domain-containing protein [Deltaproteobacteria bacterium]
HVCDSWQEYECSKTGCGGDILVKTWEKHCTGSESGCTGEEKDGAWTLFQSCDQEERCISNGNSASCDGCSTGTYCILGSCLDCNTNDHCGTACLDCTLESKVCSDSWETCEAPDQQCAGKPDFTPCSRTTDPDRAYDICVSGKCISPGCGTSTCNVPGPNDFDALPDTGLTKCYGSTEELSTCPGTAGTSECQTTAFCGQDAQYGWDVGHGPGDRFNGIEGRAGEFIVHDNVTGLEWTACAAGLYGESCDSGQVDTKFWKYAVSYCDSLDWGGKTDWRLPGVHELYSIMDLGQKNPSVNQGAFPGLPSGRFWTSTTGRLDPGNAWYVYTYNAMLGIEEKNTSRYVICVRNNPRVFVSNRFTRLEPVQNQPVVDDAVTGLEWQGCLLGQSGLDCAAGEPSSFVWRDALIGCEGSSWAGHDDWRLPDEKELQSIVDYRKYGPSIDTAFFPNTTTGSQWSSTTLYDSAGNAMLVHFNIGSVGWVEKIGGNNVRCVRNKD